MGGIPAEVGALADRVEAFVRQLVVPYESDPRRDHLMIDWCASVLDTGSLGTVESSMAKVSVSEALMKIADNCVQVMGGTGVTDKTVVEQIFREVRAFRIYDGPTEVHKWSLAKKIKRDWKAAQAATAVCP